MNKNASSFIRHDASGEMSKRQKVVRVGILLVLLLFSIKLVSNHPDLQILPGWHTTVFPFVFMQIFCDFFSGLVLLQITLLMIRRIFKWENFYSTDRMEIFNWLILISGTFVGGMTIYISIIQPMLTGFMWEFMASYMRISYLAFIAFLIALCLQFLPQLFWSKEIRRSVKRTFWICVVWWVPFLLEKLVLAVSYMGL